jgi:hydroxymethylglutaryl-CoA synthase
MRGILSHGAYLPYRRLDRSTIAAVAGGGGGKGFRTVASYDEDATTWGVAAARLARRAAPGVEPAVLSFSTVSPPYLDKTNATAIHAALRLDSDVAAFDFGGSVRSALGALLSALASSRPALVIAADVRTGLPGGADEAAGGDGAAALLIGDETDGPVVAELLASASATDEFVDRWRSPGDVRSKVWEEKFGETRYLPLGEQAWTAALKQAELTPDQVDRVIVTSAHARAAASLARRLGTAADALVDDLSSTVGHTGAAHPGLLLAATLDTATPGQVVALVSLSDGADVLLWRVTPAAASYRAARPVAEQVAAGGPVAYGKFLAWRGILPVEPPRRPEPLRVSAAAAGRNEEWKFGFVGSRDQASGAVHLPPGRVSRATGAIDAMDPVAMADVAGTIVTYTVDRLAYSPSPPIVFAVVDFDGGGRLPVELTDVDVSELAIGGRVEMTFRKLFTADGIHNYFWKARPVRA